MTEDMIRYDICFELQIANVYESPLNLATVCEDLISVFYSANSWLGESVCTLNC